MRKVLVLLAILPFVLSVACGGGSSSVDEGPDPVLEVSSTLQMDDWPFDPLDAQDRPLVFDGKAWMWGIDQTPLKADMAPDYAIFLWSSPDMVTWTKHISAADALFRLYDSEFFIFNSAVYCIGMDKFDSEGMWWSANGDTWTAVSGYDGLPFDTDGTPEPFAYGNKMWEVGTEYLPVKADCDVTPGTFLWNSTDGVNWTKVINIEDLPFDVMNCSDPFVFKGYMYLYATPKESAAKTDSGVSCDLARFWYTLDGIVWLFVNILLYDNFGISVSPQYTDFFVVLGVLYMFGYFMGASTKVDGVAEEGEYLCFSKNVSNWKTGPSLEDLGLGYDGKDGFELNGKMYIMYAPWDGDPIVKVVENTAD